MNDERLSSRQELNPAVKSQNLLRKKWLLGEEPHGAELEISDVRLLDKFQRLQRLNKRDRVRAAAETALASRQARAAAALAKIEVHGRTGWWT